MNIQTKLLLLMIKIARPETENIPLLIIRTKIIQLLGWLIAAITKIQIAMLKTHCEIMYCLGYIVGYLHAIYKSVNRK